MGNELEVIQSHLSEMALDIVQLCVDNDIQLYAVGGTLLGAYRHQGFIPWDDDLDFAMKRKDIPRFEALINQTEMYEIKIPSVDSKGNNVRFPKIFRNNTVYKQSESKVDFDQRLFIDIFTIENVPNNKFKRLIHGLKSEFLSMIGAYTFFSSDGKYLLSKKNAFSKLIIKFVNLLFGFKNYSFWNGKAYEVFGKYQNIETELVTIPGGTKHYFGEILEKLIFGEGKKMSFGSGFIISPDFPEKYLNNRYGPDYMQLPEESDRMNHNIVYFEIDGKVILK